MSTNADWAAPDPPHILSQTTQHINQFSPPKPQSHPIPRHHSQPLLLPGEQEVQAENDGNRQVGDNKAGYGCEPAEEEEAYSDAHHAPLHT